MFLLHVLLYLFDSPNPIHAAPVSPVQGSPVDIQVGQTTPPILHHRSLLDIIWTCAATIFTCTWVSVHPDVPEYGESAWRSARNRLSLMLWTIVAPEMTILRAMREWHGARTLARKYQNQGWTNTHGYFLQMGGFNLFKGDYPQGVLTPGRLGDMIYVRRIVVPILSEEDINDRSKGDGLSKGLVVLQTTWFVVQCIARKIQGLVITQLELGTLAFAVLNGVMYYLWWNKPLGVKRAIPVYLVDDDDVLPDSQAVPFGGISAFGPTGKRPELLPTSDNALRPNDKGVPIPGIPVLLNPADKEGLGIDTPEANKSSRKFTLEKNVSMLKSTYANLRNKRRTANDVAVDEQQDAWREPPRLSASDYVMFGITAIFAILFGAIHCAGWSYIFPSSAEAKIWRTCSVAITVTPCLIIARVFWSTDREVGYRTSPTVKLCTNTLEFLAFVSMGVYVRGGEDGVVGGSFGGVESSLAGSL